LKIERFKFGKGISSEKDGTWKKEYLEVEVKLPDTATDKDFQDEFTAAEYMIDNMLVGVPGMEKQEKPTAKTSNNAMLLMTFEEIEAQDWKASKWVRPMDAADRKARLGEDAYMPTTVADKRLIEMIKQSPDSKLVLPPYTEITFGGDGGLIIRKGPHSKEKKSK
jgi:hypothetical protein